MNKYIASIIIAMFLFGMGGIVYKTMQLRASINHMSLEVSRLDLATEELLCDIQRVHAYEAGYAKGVQEKDDE